MTSSRPLTAHCSLLTTHSGFTLVELLISVAILTMISTATVFSLRSSQQREELQPAVRLLAGDIKNIQARALAGENVLTCTGTSSFNKVCEQENPSPEVCSSSCVPTPPPRFGIRLVAGQTSYTLYADVEAQDARLTSARETIVRRNLNPLGTDRVEISKVQTENGIADPNDVTVDRQNGKMRLNACGSPGFPSCAPSEPQTMTITLRHRVSNQTTLIELNALTGRVSSQ